MTPSPLPSSPDVEVLLRRYETEPEHVHQVASLADALFIGLHSLHGQTPHARWLLHLAALLHDIGWSQTPDGSGHHKHSARLIRTHVWIDPALTADDISAIALIARYHRKKLPQPHHRAFAQLSATGQRLVSDMAALLRVADALDVLHRAQIQSLSITAITPEAVAISLRSHSDGRAEAQAVIEKADLFQRQFHRTLELNWQSV